MCNIMSLIGSLCNIVIKSRYSREVNPLHINILFIYTGIYCIATLGSVQIRHFFAVGIGCPTEEQTTTWKCTITNNSYS